MKRVRIGAGAGFADDRIAPAVELAERGDLNFLVFECLAERTIALAQLEKLADPSAGYNEWLAERMQAVLKPCARRGTRIITNMGAANPRAAADVVARIARQLGINGLRIATITGDDVLRAVRDSTLPLWERDGTVQSLGSSLVSANAYLGVEAILEALGRGADVIVGGRVADPSLFLAPLIHEFGWNRTNWDLMATGTAVGHLLECSAQVSGGYFADPGYKDVPDLAALGFPLAEVTADGAFTVTKVAGTGGLVNVATVTEQLLYEVQDPARYITPDVVADFSGAQLTQVKADAVAVAGVHGHPRPDTLKVSVGYLDSYIGEGQISYTGPNCAARARQALDLVRDRLKLIGVALTEARFELIGVNAVHRGAGPVPGVDPAEVRIRVIARTDSLDAARRVGREVTALWLNGPAGGGGAVRSAVQDVAIVSVSVPRDQVTTTVEIQES